MQIRRITHQNPAHSPSFTREDVRCGFVRQKESGTALCLEAGGSPAADALSLADNLIDGRRWPPLGPGQLERCICQSLHKKVYNLPLVVGVPVMDSGSKRRRQHAV